MQHHAEITFVWTVFTNIVSAVYTFWKDRRIKKRALKLKQTIPNKRLKELIEKFLSRSITEREKQEFIFQLEDVKRNNAVSSDIYFYADMLLQYLKL